ncbi:hypothetical protein [Nannocystis pusilla]|uniref:hypothetical protein n=1 Tax=Nannocystis pusilla TaxID=889268 RepID=UPI003B82A41E
MDRAEEHVESLARRSAVETLDPAARLLIAQSAAGMAEEILGDRARALGLLAAMLDAGIADEATARHIERLARAGGEKRLLARALRESAKLALGQAGRADILVRLGDAEFDTGELTGATEAYSDALDERPGFAGAVAGLERVLDRLQKTGGEVGQTLIEPLENSYHLAGNRPGLAKLARLRLQAATGPTAPPRWRTSAAWSTRAAALRTRRSRRGATCCSSTRRTRWRSSGWSRCPATSSS